MADFRPLKKFKVCLPNCCHVLVTNRSPSCGKCCNTSCAVQRPSAFKAATSVPEALMTDTSMYEASGDKCEASKLAKIATDQTPNGEGLLKGAF